MQQTDYRILVLGGYGHFGARIVRALSSTPGITVIAAGRRPERAAANLPGIDLSQIEQCRLDTYSPDFSAQLAATRARLVIHTAGPFQEQGYDVATACIKAGIHYIDIADGRTFVRDFSAQMNNKAAAAGCCAISGASTLPALSAAVVDALKPQLDRLDSIDIVIAPAQATPLGTATVKAVLSYCGKSFNCLIDGHWQSVTGWAAPKSVEFSRIAPRLAAGCDVPDHDILVSRYPGVKTVRFQAALEVSFLSRCLAAAAWLRRNGMPLPMDAVAGIFSRAGRLFDRFGTDLGGMRVTVKGINHKGLPETLHWDLTAPMLHGPEIPTFASILLARRFARGETFPPGAFACVGFLTLAEFESEFVQWQIDSEIS